MRTIGALIISALLAACTAGSGGVPSSSPPGSAPPSPSPVATPATATVDPSPIETLPPSEAPSPAPTARSSLVGLAPTVVDPVLELRIEIRGDVPSGGWAPVLSVYRDGTVLQGTELGPRITRLTPEGLARLRKLATDTGLLDASRSIPVDGGWDAGFTSYVITLRSASGMIRVATPNAVIDADRAAADAIIALAERLAAPATQLNDDAWLIPPSRAALFVPNAFLLKVTLQASGWSTDDPNRPGLDVEQVAWPLPGSPSTWGKEYPSPFGPGSHTRCAPIGIDDAVKVERALAPAWGDELLPASGRMLATLLWASKGQQVEISLGGLLPDAARECAADDSWP